MFEKLYFKWSPVCLNHSFKNILLHWMRCFFLYQVRQIYKPCVYLDAKQWKNTSYTVKVFLNFHNSDDLQLLITVLLANLWFFFFFSFYWSCVCVLVVQLCQTLCDLLGCAHQAPLSLGFSRQEYWCGLPFSSPGHLAHPGIEPESCTLQAGSLPSGLLGKSLLES